MAASQAHGLGQGWKRILGEGLGGTGDSQVDGQGCSWEQMVPGMHSQDYIVVDHAGATSQVYSLGHAPGPPAGLRGLGAAILCLWAPPFCPRVMVNLHITLLYYSIIK